MRKFTIPKRRSKRAYPRATYLGDEVMVRGVSRLDEARRVYYRVKHVEDRTSTKAVRCDKLIAL
jgi:hypothetical protein